MYDEIGKAPVIMVLTNLYLEPNSKKRTDLEQKGRK
jgi:hypothetical protein